MNLRFALLAMLSAGPRSGYDLMQAFDRTVDFVWHAPHSQIYPELRRMEEDGLVGSEEVPRGPKGTKRIYRITDDGLAKLRHDASTVAAPLPPRDPVRLWAAYLEWADPTAAREQLRLHIAYYEERLESWSQMQTALERREEPTLQLRLSAMPAERHDAIVAAKLFAYEGLVDRARMEIAWAERGLRLIDDVFDSDDERAGDARLASSARI